MLLLPYALIRLHQLLILKMPFLILIPGLSLNRLLRLPGRLPALRFVRFVIAQHKPSSLPSLSPFPCALIRDAT